MNDTTTLELPVWKGEPGWEFTSLKGLDLDAFEAPDGGDLSAVDAAASLFEGLPAPIRLDQVDALASDPVPLASDEAPLVLPLRVALERHPDLVGQHLGSVVIDDEDVFTARNADGWAGGAFIHVPRNARLDAPVLITALAEQADRGLHWRTLIVLDEGAEAEVWEQHLGTGGLLNTVVELVVGPNATLRYVHGQERAEDAWIFGTQRAKVDRDGVLDWTALGFGGGHGKVRMETRLEGAGANGKVTGVYAAARRQHIDFDTTQEHAAPSCVSDLAFRGILTARSSSVWRGMIKVDPGAQQTDAFQESRNLLLSKRAHADAIPGLEILANDVRCTHAAAVAQIDPEQLFYLRARGLDGDVAKRLVVEGFIQALVERFPEGHVRDTLAGTLDRRLASVLGS